MENTDWKIGLRSSWIADGRLPVMSGSKTICYLGRQRTNKETKNNARLICAAPKLLKACKEAIRQLKQTGADPEDYEELTTAIQEAKRVK